MRGVRRLRDPDNYLAAQIYWPANAARRKGAHHSHRAMLFEKKWTTEPLEREMLPAWVCVLAVAVGDRRRCSNGG